jgi:NTE family protein
VSTALVVSGGGSKGAFAVGAVKYLVEEAGMSFDILAGTSTGALVTVMVAADAADGVPILETEYTTAGPDTIIEERSPPAAILTASSIYTTRGLESRIRALITEERFQRLVQSGRTLLLATVELESGLLVYWHTGPDFTPAHGEARRITTRGTLMRALLASAAIPVAMPPVRIDGTTFVDGGVREYAPIEVTADAGGEDIVCIMLSPDPHATLFPGPARTAAAGPFDRILPIARRSLDLMMEEGAENDLRAASTYISARAYLDRLARILALEHGWSEDQVASLFGAGGRPLLGRRAATLRVIRPAATLPGHTLGFDPAVMRANLELGFRRAAEILSPDDGGP